jgi:signal transduction histidine kinase
MSILARVILLSVFICIVKPIAGQTVVPQEDGGSIVPIDLQLPFPENYDLALKFVKEKQADNQQVATLYYGQQALSFAKDNKDEARYLEATQVIARLYQSQGQYENADSLYVQGLNYVKLPLHKAEFYLDRASLGVRTRDWQNTDEFLQKARQLIGKDTLSVVMANYHYRTGVYEFEAKQNMVEALVHYRQAKKIEGVPTRMLTSINNNLAIIYSAVNDFSKAHSLNEENLQIAIEEDDMIGQLFAYYGLAFTSAMMGNDSNLILYCQKAISLHNTTGISTAFGYIYSLLGEYYMNHNQLDSAEYYLQKGIIISKQQGENKELVDCYQGMMKLYTLRGENEIAIEYGELGLLLGTRVDHEIEDPLATLYENRGDYKRAYDLLRKSWIKLTELDQSKTNISLMAKLLEDRFEQERTQQAFEHQQILTQQRFALVTSALALIIFLTLLIVLLQAKSRRKLQQLNHSLTESNDALMQFAYITSHDLKEPVRNITSFSGLLKRRLAKRESTTEETDFLDFITSNAAVLKEIVDSLQVFTKISFGELEHEAVALKEVFQTVENNLQQVVQETNGQLTFHNPQQIEKVFFARPMLILVLQNLVQNGFKYNESDLPQVSIHVATGTKGKTFFQVIDNGIGIEEAYFERIFTPFKTLKNKSITQSSGLGLSICKTILERYGGSIEVASDGKNGSTFSFWI